MAEKARQGFLSPPDEGVPSAVDVAPSTPATALAEVRGFPASSGPLDLDVRIGDIVHLRGGNGSGKTSLLRQLAGLEAPMRARAVRLQGVDARTLPGPALSQAVRAVWASPHAGLVGLTVAGEFRLRAAVVPPTVAGLADRAVATLSAGEARRVALAVATASSAPLLLLDEPCTALDADGLVALQALVREAAGTGAVVLADHSGWAERIATRSVDLAPPPRPIGLVLPRPANGAVVLEAPSASVRRGPLAVALPAVHVGAGFHVATGRNGAGKTTLLERLSGLHDAEGVTVAGRAPRAGSDTRLLPSEAGELLVADTVRAELEGTADPEGLVPPALLARHPMSLSAGEAHRVALVKVLGRPAPVHLLDEPEAHLDADARWRVLAAIARLLATGACVIAATHDADLVAAAHMRIEVGA